MPETHLISPIATIQTPFRQKFGIPRQASLSAAKGVIHFDDGFDAWASIKGIEQHSHIWLIFQFDQNIEKGWKPSVRPPRLGGNEKLGVFATRSSFRPNGLGMSVVKLESIDNDGEKPKLVVSNVDMLTDTPIIDIKPYIPYADNITEATSEIASEAPAKQLSVEYSARAKKQIESLDITKEELSLIDEILNLDPRPAYKANKPDDKHYHLAVYNYDIEWYVKQNTCQVENIAPFKAELENV